MSRGLDVAWFRCSIVPSRRGLLRQSEGFELQSSTGMTTGPRDITRDTCRQNGVLEAADLLTIQNTCNRRQHSNNIILNHKTAVAAVRGSAH